MSIVGFYISFYLQKNHEQHFFADLPWTKWSSIDPIAQPQQCLNSRNARLDELQYTSFRILFLPLEPSVSFFLPTISMGVPLSLSRTPSIFAILSGNFWACIQWGKRRFFPGDSWHLEVSNASLQGWSVSKLHWICLVKIGVISYRRVIRWRPLNLAV